MFVCFKVKVKFTTNKKAFSRLDCAFRLVTTESLSLAAGFDITGVRNCPVNHLRAIFLSVSLCQRSARAQ